MSITSDIRSYADSAVSQGKQVFDQSLATAQAQLNGVTGTANEYVGPYLATARENVSDITEKAAEAVTDLRTSAEKAINFDAIKHAVEPYLNQVKGYGSLVTDRAEGIVAGITSDERVAKIVGTAGTVTTVVRTQVQERVVKPVRSLTGLGATTTKPAPARATKPAATRPSSVKPATRRPSTAAKASPKPRTTTAKTGTPRTTTARTTTAKATTAKATTAKAPAVGTPAEPTTEA